MFTNSVHIVVTIFNHYLKSANLGNVHTLDLHGCNNITDISELGNVHTLYLSKNNNITKESIEITKKGRVQIIYN